jgi:uncharacterized Ntn-hydrolase superfamily protein
MKTLVSILSLFISTVCLGQDTFSIIAIDSVTGEIGSAGASCVAHAHPDSGVIIISTIIPGRGAIHTQAYYHPANQNNARQKMLEGLSPDEIMDWLKNNDVANRMQQRQYGIADMDNGKKIRVAAFTGVSCNAYKSHIIGKNYCIQGNILAGQFVLDSMEHAFNRTAGTLADKLMAAMLAAKIPGADTRCSAEGVSSKSAFMCIAKPTDKEGAYFIELNVNNHPPAQDPIDILKMKYELWKNSR